MSGATYYLSSETAQKYHHNPAFKAVTDSLCSAVLGDSVTPDELLEATRLAIYQAENIKRRRAEQFRANHQATAPAAEAARGDEDIE